MKRMVYDEWDMAHDIANRRKKFERQLKQTIQKERKIALDVLSRRKDSPNKVVQREMTDAYWELRGLYNAADGDFTDEERNKINEEIRDQFEESKHPSFGEAMDHVLNDHASIAVMKKLAESERKDSKL